MSTTGKRFKEALTKLDRSKLYTAEEAVGLLKGLPKAEFNETVELHIVLGIDPKKTDQSVRGTVVLPYGTGKTPRVIAFAKGDKAKEAEQAGADEVGTDELVQKVKGGWSDFDVVVAAPDMMATIGSQLGKVLGPRMPNPKAGTVSLEIGKMIREIKSGKVQYRIDKQGIIHVSIGKASFEKDQLVKNLTTLMDAIVRAKPAASKGTYLRSVTLTSTMGPGIRLDGSKLTAVATAKE